MENSNLSEIAWQSKAKLWLSTLKKKIKTNPIATVLIVVALIAIVQGYKYSQQVRKHAKILSPDYIGKSLVVVEAKLDSKKRPNSLIVRFNHPVSAHQLEHMVSMTPAISGFWDDDTSQNVVYYTFEEQFEGSYIDILILEGLKSINNATLLSDYTQQFYIAQESPSTFDYDYSRVKTFPAGKPIPFRTGKDSISVYKSDASTLLSFLTYTLSESEKRGGTYSGEYTNDSLDLPEANKLEELKFDDDKQTLLLPPGVYYIREDNRKPFFAVVSDFGVLMRQDDKQVIVGAFDLQSGAKISDQVTFGFYNLKRNVNLLRDFAYSESNNSIPLNYPTKLDAIIAIHGDQVAFVPVELPTSFADIQVNSDLDTDTQLFLYTDRPIYKPGDTVFVKGIVRQDSDAQYRLSPRGTPVYLEAFTYDDKYKLNQTVALDEFGTFNSHFVIPEDYDSQYSYVRASTKVLNETNYGDSATFEVVKYIKPEFEIKTKVERGEYIGSEKIKFTISGNYFDGKPLQNKEVEYSVYTDNFYEVEKAVYNKSFNVTSFGGMCGGGDFSEYYGEEYKKGKVTLDGNGEASIEVNADEKNLLSQKITLTAKIVDKNSNEIVSASNTIVHAADFNIFFMPSADEYSPGEQIVAPFYAETLSGDRVGNKEFEYKLIDFIYDKNTQQSLQKILTSGTITSDSDGKGIVKFSYSADNGTGSKVLQVISKDDKNNTAQNQKSISITTPQDDEQRRYTGWWDPISQTYLKISSNQNSFQVGDMVSLNIESPRELDTLVTLERGRVYYPQFLHLDKGSNTFTFKVGEDLSPSITVVFSFFSEGKYYTEGLALNVPAMHKLLQIDLKLNKKSYKPSETAELRVTTKDASGNPIPAQMSLGIVDKAIYALRKSATPPLHSSFYYFRPRRTNASSSLTGMGLWGGGGGGGGGFDSPSSTADILYWDPNLRTDESGEALISIPLLGHETTWKAQVLGTTFDLDLGQADTEFIVTSDVKGAKSKRKSR